MTGLPLFDRLPSNAKEGHVLFVGLNPSRATAEVDDNTIRKEMKYARAWGFHEGQRSARFSVDAKHRFDLTRPGLVKANLFSFRSTYPEDLVAYYDRGTQAEDAREANRYGLCQMAGAAAMVVCAWGGPYQPKKLGALVREEAALVVAILRDEAKALHVLQLTKDGIPRHPLYLKDELLPFVWEGT